MLSILSIFNLVLVYAFAGDPSLQQILSAMNALFSLIFLGDFLYRIFTVPSPAVAVATKKEAWRGPRDISLLMAASPTAEHHAATCRGLAIAEGLSEAGARVAITGRRRQWLDSA